MNTLEELNTYSNSQIPFVDDRSLIITTATTDTTTQSVNVAEDAAVDLSTFGVTFDQLRSLDNATPDHITLEFDFSAALNPGVVWPAKDAFIEGNTKYNNIIFSSPTPGVFVADKIQLNSDYLAVLANTDIAARDQVAAYSYTITVSWPGNTFTQQFDVTTIPSAETNLNGLSLTATAIGQHLLFDPSLTPRPAIVDTAPNSIYELEFTSTAGATLATAQGNTPTTSITLSGDKDAVNTVLQNVRYSPLDGFINSTDVINYTLTVTNPSVGIPYVSETGSFDNYVPAFGEVFNLTPRTNYSSLQQDLFISPYPYVEDSIGSSLIQLTISATTGQLKASTTTGSWGSTVVLNGSDTTLSAALQLIQYIPAVVDGSNTETFSFTLTWSGFTLDTGTFNVTTVLDATVVNVNNLSDNVTEPDVALLFPATWNGGVAPQITGADTNSNYNLTITYGNSEINGIQALSIGFNGTLGDIQTEILAATYRPLGQTFTDSMTYTLTLDGVTMDSGSFDKVVETFFTWQFVPTSVTIPNTNDYKFITPASIADTSSGYENLSATFTITAGDSTFAANGTQTITLTGYVSPNPGDPDIINQIQNLVYDPDNISVSTSIDTVDYTLDYNGITWDSGSIAVTVQPDIVLSNFDVARVYTQNDLSDLFPSSYPSMTDVNGLTYTLRLAAPRGLIRFDTDLAPYTNSIEITGDVVAISTLLSSNTIEYIPVGDDVADVDIQYTLLHNTATIDQDTFTVSRVGGTALPGRIISTNVFSTEAITDAETYFYKCDLLLVGTGGEGGDAIGVNQSGGGGGGGNILFYEDCNFFYNRGNPSSIDVFTGGNPTSGTKAQDTVIRNGDDGVTIISAATGGGYGGDNGLDGEDGGYGGGGGGNGVNPGGSGVPGTVPPWLVANGQSLNAFGDGEDGGFGGNNAGDGGGNTSIDIDVTGTAIRYSQPGPSIGSTLYTTPGSGGAGEARDTSGNLVQPKTFGQTGLVYIKFYT